MNGEVSPTIREARDGIRSGALSAVELAKACLETADRLDNKLNVFVTRVDREVLLEQAADVDRRRKAGIELGLLAGIPIALKDIYFTSDLPTTASSKVLAGHQTNEDALTVTKLRQSGALIVGKVQTHEFAYGPSLTSRACWRSCRPKCRRWGHDASSLIPSTFFYICYLAWWNDGGK